MWEEIISKAAERLDKDPKLVKFVNDELWKAVRLYMSKPEEIKGRIYLNSFIKFYLSEKKLASYIQRMKTKPNVKQETIDYYENLFKLTKEGKAKK